MLTFKNVFNTIIFYSALAGLSVPGLPDSSELLQKVLKRYSQVSTIPLLIFFVLEVYLVIFQWDSVLDTSMSANIICVYFYSVFITVYLLLYSKKFSIFLEKLDTVGFMLYNCELCKKELYLEQQKELMKKANLYTKSYCIFIVSATIFFCIMVYMQYLGLFGSVEDGSLPYQLPFKTTSFYAYSGSLLCEALVDILSILKRISCESFIAFLFLYLNFYYKQLGLILETVFSEHTGEESHLRNWIKLQHHIQR